MSFLKFDSHLDWLTLLQLLLFPLIIGVGIVTVREGDKELEQYNRGDLCVIAFFSQPTRADSYLLTVNPCIAKNSVTGATKVLPLYPIEKQTN